MNRSLQRSILVLGALVIGIGVGAVAAIAWQDGRGQRGPGSGPPLSPVFAALDADHDGAISSAEMADAVRALKSLDKNGDAKLDPEEIRPPFGRGGGDFGRRGEGRGEPGETAPPSADDLVSTLMAFDADKDGTLTQAEVPPRMQGLFERADGDKDGKLTATELKALASSQADPSAMGPGGREGGRRGRGPGEGMRGDPLTAAIDANRDGTISPEEIAAAPDALRKLDADGDGRLTIDEVRPAFGRSRGQRPGPADGDRR